GRSSTSGGSGSPTTTRSRTTTDGARSPSIEVITAVWIFIPAPTAAATAAPTVPPTIAPIAPPTSPPARAPFAAPSTVVDCAKAAPDDNNVAAINDTTT